jgi:ribonuclease J
MNLSQEGMVVIVLALDPQTGRLLKPPYILSRGFIYLRDNQAIIDEMQKRIRSVLERIAADSDVDMEYVKTLIRDQIGQFIYQRTKRRPMLLTVVVEV